MLKEERHVINWNDFSSRNIMVVSGRRSSRIIELMSCLQHLKEVTAYIDYECGFGTKPGQICRSEARTETCCCQNCSYNYGYLAGEVIQWKDLKILKSTFDKRTGFWRSGKGCILPRRLRSITCVMYFCRLKDDEKNKKLLNFRDAARSIQDELLKELKGAGSR